MLSRSLWQQIKCRWREFRREPSAFFWVMFMPILWMVVLGFAFSKPRPESYGIGWLAPAVSSELSEKTHEALTRNPQIKLREADLGELETRIKRGEISMILQFDAQNKAVYRLDQNNPEAVRARNFVNDLVQNQGGRVDPVPQESANIQAEGGRYVDFLIPGLLGLSIMTSSLFGVGMTIVSNRKENLLKRYLATPMRSYEFIVSHIFGRLIILAAEFSAVMIAGYLIFHFRLYGNFFHYVVFAILGAAAFTSLALLCASRTRSVPMISGLTNLISLPMMMLSGVFFSKNNFPDWLREATAYLPLTALNDGLRKIALEGLSILELGPEIAVLGFYTVICAVIAQRLFKWF